MAEPVYEQYPIDQIDPADDNPRRHRGTVEEAQELGELAESIRGIGIVEPLVATTVEDTASTGRLRLIAGHRRLAAAKEAGLTQVPVLVHQRLDDRARAEMMIVENLQRSDLTPTEEAAAYEQLVRLGVKQRDLAKRVGRSQPHISRRLALLKLPPPALAAADTGGIRMEDAIALAQLPSDRVAELFTDKKPPDRWRIEREVRDWEREEATRKKLEELRAAGVTIIDDVDRYDQAKGPVPLPWLRQHEKMADHGSQPCHAVAVGEFGLTEVCTKPSRHPRPKAKGGTTDDRDWEAERAEQEARRARQMEEKDARLKVCAELVAHDSDSRATAGFLLQALTSWPPSDGLDFPVACRILGLPIRDDAHAWDDRPERQAFAAYAQESKINAARAAYALGLATCESAVPTQGTLGGADDEDLDQQELVKAYLHLLAGDGDHTPTEHELELMEEAPVEDVDQLRARALAAALTGKTDEGERSAIEFTVGAMERDELVEVANARRCRVCGCTDELGCDAGCSWADDDLCSECIGRPTVEELEELGVSRDVQAGVEAMKEELDAEGAEMLQPSVTVTPIGRTGKKFKVLCDCGFTATATTEEFGQARGRDHRTEAHGLELAEASA